MTMSMRRLPDRQILMRSDSWCDILLTSKFLLENVMKIVQMKCPNCKATLDVQNGIDTFFCTYCGTPLMLDGQSKTAIKARVRLKEMEHEERVQDRRYEHEERTQRNKYDNEAARWSRKHKSERFELKSKVVLIVAPFAALMLYFIVMFSWIDRPSSAETKHNELTEQLTELDKQIEDDILNGNYDAALLKTNRLRMDDGWSNESEAAWTEKRETYFAIIEEKQREGKPQNVTMISAPLSSEDFLKLSYDEAKQVLLDAGFHNIDDESQYGDAGFFAKSQLVTGIILGGKSNFTTEDSFPESAHVIIKHYEE